jgi:hypothetical protein
VISFVSDNREGLVLKMPSTRESDVDPAKLIPGLAGWAKVCVRLHPRPGDPSPQSSHIGGSMIWPQGEAMPFCEQHQMQFIPVLQINADDVPELPFPDGARMLQVVWCPMIHEIEYSSGYDYSGPFAMVFWRGAMENQTLTQMCAPVSLSESGNPYAPSPCTINPERVTEYPDTEELSGEIRSAILACSEFTSAEYGYGLSVARGWKIGGWPSWHSTDLQDLYCDLCHGKLDLLVKFDTSEWDGGSERWHPYEDYGLGVESADDLMEPTGVLLGNWGELRIFVCRSDVNHPHVLNIQ